MTRKIPFALFMVMVFFVVCTKTPAENTSTADGTAAPEVSEKSPGENQRKSLREYLPVLLEKNPLTGKKTLALVDDDRMFAESFTAYAGFLEDATVVNNTPDGKAVRKVGEDLRRAAEKWLAAEGRPDYFEKYKWEYNLVESPEVNAWCMPGGKIVVYTGILPVTGNNDGLATVMGHELAHALLNHGRQQRSAEILRTIGGIATDIITFVAGADAETRKGAEIIYDLGSTYLASLPFSRKHETEADEVGLILMTIAGYKSEESIAFWTRMSEMNGSKAPAFLSTHPSNKQRVANLSESISNAKETASRIR
ncbi:peptidase M48 [Spirochaetia bacterium]|nr:peptidase M48 [Spirochaetia bacterium]